MPFLLAVTDTDHVFLGFIAESNSASTAAAAEAAAFFPNTKNKIFKTAAQCCQPFLVPFFSKTTGRGSAVKCCFLVM